jgi:adenine-specific DNA methylase
MLKRLIEVALPLKEVSEQSAREKSIRHGHISTLHIWWARRPLAACRAAIFASLIPDPDDPECPPQFRKLVMEVLGRGEFTPKNGEGSPVEDTPRNRCLEFIKHLVRWENSNDPEYIEPAKTLIAAAHKFLLPSATGDAPKVLDPFTGGGAIPLEALRLGCEAHAVDLNPVAHLIELCTLVYPQKYGQPKSRSAPDYIKRLIAHNKAKKKGASGRELFDDGEAAPTIIVDEVIPDVEITEAEYKKNPLAADVKYWGHWVLAKARQTIERFYPLDSSGGTPVAYLWARTIECPNPTCKAIIPLLPHTWLCKKSDRSVALKIEVCKKDRTCTFVVHDSKSLDFDPGQGTMQRGNALCPFCKQVASASYLRSQAQSGKMGQIMTTVISVKPGQAGKRYLAATEQDRSVFIAAHKSLEELKAATNGSLLPTEAISRGEPRRISPPLYGLERFVDLFNSRQLLALATFASVVSDVITQLQQHEDEEYAAAVGTYLGLCVSRFADFNSSLCTLNTVGGRGVAHTFTRQSLPMVWDYAESTPFNQQGANWESCIDAAHGSISLIQISRHATVSVASATAIPIDDQRCAAVITDPPYYDAVPYSDLSDFFYVWLKRTLERSHAHIFRTPLTPKQLEIVEQRPHKSLRNRKDSVFYESMMGQAFCEAHRVLEDTGIMAVMFAHKTTSAWESLISGLLRSGITISGSWPLHTEKPGRMNSIGTASLASSVTLVCRKRHETAGNGLWDDVRQELRTVAQERLDFFWRQGIRGADFFISAIGPALSVFGKYDMVTKLSGEEVSVGQFLDEVRGLVTSYALAKILKTTHTGIIDPESRFYVVWKWSYADAKVPADESFKLSQALGLNSETLWDSTGVLEKSGENVQATPVAKRIKVKTLGEPAADGAPASVIDVLHRMCAFREKGDTQGMAEFLGRSGHANNHSLWLIAQAVSEILSDGDKEKQLMQGLLNQKEGLEAAARDKKLF